MQEFEWNNTVQYISFSMIGQITEESFSNVTQQSTDGNNDFNGRQQASIPEPTNQQFVENDNAQCSEKRKSTVFCDCSRIHSYPVNDSVNV